MVETEIALKLFVDWGFPSEAEFWIRPQKLQIIFKSIHKEWWNQVDYLKDSQRIIPGHTERRLNLEIKVEAVIALQTEISPITWQTLFHK